MGSGWKIVRMCFVGTFTRITILVGALAFSALAELQVYGMESAVYKEFNWGESEPDFPGQEEYSLYRRIYTPIGFGARLDAFDKVYGEWEVRLEGQPMWKVEFGYRIY